MIQRNLEKAGKSLNLTADDRSSAEVLIAQSKTKLKQGWAPVEPPADSVKLGRNLLALGLSPSEFVAAFNDAEVDALYAQLIRDEHERLDEYTLRARPTRALLDYLMRADFRLVGGDFSKAIKFIAKNEDVAKWVVEAMNAALANNPSPQLKKFAAQQLRNLEKRAEVHEVPKIVEGNETALLEAIAENPSADDLRRVYADFLLEKGIGWGEVIPLSLVESTWEYGTPEYTANSEQLAKLTKKHLKQWLEPIRPFITGWSVTRGLLSTIDTQPSKFLEAADAIALRAPRATLMLGGLKSKEVAALAASPLGKFEEVRLSQQRLTDADMVTIAASATIAGVENWDLGGNHFGDEGVRAIATSAHFASVKTLDLSTIDVPVITGDGLHALLSSKSLSSLTYLLIGVTSVKSAFDDVQLKLTTFTLSIGGNIDDTVCDALSKLTTLESLSVQFNSRVRGVANVTEAALFRLVETLPKLTSLTVQGVAMPDAVEATLTSRRSARG